MTKPQNAGGIKLVNRLPLMARVDRRLSESMSIGTVPVKEFQARSKYDRSVRVTIADGKVPLKLLLLRERLVMDCSEDIP